jgi:hypothetical protein
MGTDALDKNGANNLGALVDELKQESDRLRQLAEKLQAREKALAEMEANYPYFKAFVYKKLREEAERTLEPLPENVDLEAYARERGAQPIEPLLEELERLAKGS